MGPKQINDFTMLGTMLPAEEARKLGIVNRVVPREKLDETAMVMAGQLLAKNPWALSRIKYANYGQANMTVSDALDAGNEMATMWLQLNDVKEGVRAFLDKRKPDYEQFRGKVKHVPPYQPG